MKRGPEKSTARCSLLRYIAIIFLSMCFALLCGAPANALTFTANVKNYGARGDGKTDDTYAIYRAILAVRKVTDKNHNNANSVYFPPGKYVIGKYHPNVDVSGFTLKGLNANPPVSTLLLQDPNAQVRLTNPKCQLLWLNITNAGSQHKAGVRFAAAPDSLVSIVNVSGFDEGIRCESTSNLTIQFLTANIPEYGTGIKAKYESSVSISDCKFVGPGNGETSWGITYDSRAENIAVKNSSFSQVYYGLLYQNLSGATRLPGVISISGCTFDHCYASASVKYLKSFTFNNNTSTNVSYGVWIENSSTSVVSNNKIVAPVYYGIYATKSLGLALPNYSLTASGNTITDVGSGYYGIYAQGSNITASGNTLTGSGAKYGIYCYNLSYNGNNLVFKDNNISGFGYGIATLYCHDTQSTGNTISNIQNNAIYSYHDTQLTANQNTLSNCGLASGAYAVIYVIGANSTNSNMSYTVTNNSYTAASTPNLDYFVYVDASNNNDVHMSGNTTNTLLPSYP